MSSTLARRRFLEMTGKNCGRLLVVLQLCLQAPMAVLKIDLLISLLGSQKRTQTVPSEMAEM